MFQETEFVQLERQFFQKVVRHHEQDHSIDISEVLQSDACEKGNNFMALVTRIGVRGFRKTCDQITTDYHNNFIIKQKSANEKHAEMCNSEIAFQNEVVAYTKIVPTLNKYASQPLDVPDCYYTENNLIVMQDLKDVGYQLADKKKGLTLNQVKNVLNKLAKLHAASLTMQQTAPEKFAQLTNTLTEVLYKPNHAPPILKWQERSLQTAHEILKQEPSKNACALKIFESWNGATTQLQSTAIARNRKHAVVNHGDLWLNNIMLNKVDDVKLIDLQAMRCTSVAADLSYFLFVNLKAEVFLENAADLLETYLTLLRANVGDNRWRDVDKELTIEWLRGEMREFFLFGVANALWFLPLFYFEFEEMLKWNALEHEDVGSVVCKLPVAYKERIRDVILCYVDILNNVYQY